MSYIVRSSITYKLCAFCMVWGSGCIIHIFLIHGPASLPPEKEPACTHWFGGWVGPRVGLHNVEKRTFLILPGLELRPLGRPARSQSLYRVRYPGSCETSRLPHFRENLLTDGGEVVNLTRRPAALYPPGRFVVLIFVRGLVDSGTIVRREGLGRGGGGANNLISTVTRYKISGREF
jgi:hypothetical protein